MENENNILKNKIKTIKHIEILNNKLYEDKINE